LINPGYKICGEKSSVQAPTLLALVISSADRFERRLAIRGTWSNRNLFPQMRSVFLIGDSQNKATNEKIKTENEIFGDIVQESFIDSYNNLTLKTVMGFKWASTYCSQAKFFLKVDDDVLVDSYSLMGYLESMINLAEPLTNTFMCLVQRNATVSRNPDNKYFMSCKEYSEDYYKTYCSGK
jgi:beta-1,3-galactosyltransferase 1